MLKKISAIFLIVTSWLMMTATPVRADVAPPIHCTYPEGGGFPTDCWVGSAPPRPQPWSHVQSSSFSDFSLISLPLYLIVFALNYTIEYCVGSLMGLSKYKRYARTVLLANIITHPLLTLTMVFFIQFFSDNYFNLWLAEFLVMSVETVIIWRWYHRQQTNQTSNSTVFTAFVYCTIANLTSFLVGMFISSIAPFSGFVLSDRPSPQPDTLYYLYCIIATIIFALFIWILHFIRRKLTPPSQSA